MRRQLDWRRWRGAIVSGAVGSAIFVLAWSKGHGWELLWLPAVMLGAAWPRASKQDAGLGKCLSGKRRGPGPSGRR
jgi:hypothetical protein